MKAKDYRRRIEEQSAQATEAVPVGDGGASARPAEPDWPELIARLADPSQTSEARRTAIHALQAGAFLSARFASCRPGFVAALRKAAVDPDDEKLRHSALDALANMNDEFARQQLVKGLEGDGEPLVPPAVALGLLARDDHASASGIARRIIESDAGRHVKEQAVRLLSADPRAHDLLERLLQDKNEFREVRRASAAALQKLNPAAFVETAHQLLADDGEFQDIRKTLRSALERANIPVRRAPAEPAGGAAPPPPAGEGVADRALGWLRGLFGSRTRR